jgi:7-keto-8-aminopelargonate synthetase-like enzyme
MLDENLNLVTQLQKNTKQFRTCMKQAGFKIIGHEMSPIAPVWLGDAKIASELSNKLL